MDFEQMRIVWDEQKQQRVYALDLDALHEIVRRRGRRIARAVDVMEIGMVVFAIAGVAILATKAGLAHTSRQYLSVAVLVAVAAYLIDGRLRRRSRERAFEPNLLGDLDLAIAQLEYHVRRIRTFPLWFCAPLLVPVLVGLVTRYEAAQAWKWAAVLLAFPLSIYVTRLELRCLLPRKRELEALRAKLANES